MQSILKEVKVIDHSDRVEVLFEPYGEIIGQDFAAYRGHVYRVITYAMHFLGNDERHRAMVETAFVYHDIGLWTHKDLAYLGPSEEIALQDNATKGFGLDPVILKAAIHWHHKITPYSGPGANVVNAVRKADWIDATQGLFRKGLSKAQIAYVEAAIPDHGFPHVLQRLAKDYGGNSLSGNLRVLRHVFKF
ncbi:MAG: hypothetical protein RIC14_10765 [Filomicrobium sp.]